MAPVLSIWWGPEAGVLRSTGAVADGAAPWFGGGQLALVATLSVLAALLLVSVLLLLCASCQGQKKTGNGLQAGDHENLMNGVPEKETISQSADSPVTDMAVSTSLDGPLTCGTILTDTQDTSPQLSEEMLSIQSELRSSKCPQDRELPSIPPNNSLIGDGPPASGDSTYEVVKELAVASRDVSVEDSLYETVTELKDPPTQLSLANGTIHRNPEEPLPHSQLNGHPSPCTPERGPLCVGVEYASVDLKKKSRHSVDMEARRCSENIPSHKSLEVEDLPPPVPVKVLDENDNHPLVNGLAGTGLHNGELHSPPSPTPGLDNHFLSDNESDVYSTVNNTNCDDGAYEEDREHDYSSIAEIKGLVPVSSSSDLYATVRDIYTQPDETQAGVDPTPDSMDPGYETIRIPKISSLDDEHLDVPGPDIIKTEPDYESVGELGLNRESSRL
ncbi:phosphoprotein associated with glycosphingolipid-enriched microdomains 1 [Gouania willdenowi]|uniref:Phosphoprotein membrane anchor with glycosphingolipid microdomains 1 n=1 Tax=Gouania willdenowi TaxID=441366 RepID=A0A8C5D8S0_GOUWI|nr:phosphoprotein associated with glycosphingolipid-enriched microdomains 1 [Gouania willdenowi]XP_028317763.1 phosphoprotein associated with glycosphingolipid-enriched microdomains 1 [Gouania willdenowi]